MKATRLRTNYRINPLGIDDSNPRFTWNCENGRNQTAYRVCAFADHGEVLFDTGRRENASMNCRYDGKTLKSRQRVKWNVQIWDEFGECTVSETAWFEMGLLNPEDWQAKWITGVDTDRKERLPADYYRREFNLKSKLRKARLYATSCGVYAVWINGKRLPGVLAPGCTEYEKRLHYQVYDVTDYVKKCNTMDFAVGDGWYKGKLGSSNIEYFFGQQTALFAQLELYYEDGSMETICTDDRFLWCNDGPIRFADLKDGEEYDARCVPSFDRNAVCLDRTLPLTASALDMITENEVFQPTLLRSPSGACILDFHQNLAGYIRFRTNGRSGQKIILRMCETLDHGEYSNKTLLHVEPNTPSVNQKIVYICNGEDAVFQPEFFYSGFRYALVEGLEQLEPNDFEAVAVYTPMEFTGVFQCSNPLINQFLENTRWSLKSNFVDIPTDCPQREKSGWTGDAQVFVETASYLADTAAFYRKWLKDVLDCQREDGRIENVCPKIRGVDERDVLNGSVGWADAAVIIPYTLWKLYGDDRFIHDNYALMHGWKEYVIKAAADKTYYHLPDSHPLKQMVAPYLLPESPYNRYVIETGLHWGEWCEPDVDGGSELVRPKPEITSAYMHYSMTLLSEMLNAVGMHKEAEQCEAYADGAKKAYQFHFVKDGKIAAPRQAPMVRALALDLLDEKDRRSVAASLNEDVIARQYKVGTGFLSTPFVLPVLAENGYVQSAYKMLENTEAPAWLAMPKHGATTVWENYVSYDENGSPKTTSLNHYSPGAVCAFLFNTVCGISVTGENRFRIKPVPGGTLTYANAEYLSPYGEVKSSWKCVDNGYEFEFTVPSNTTADVILPDGQFFELGSGIHSFTIYE